MPCKNCGGGKPRSRQYYAKKRQLRDHDRQRGR